MTGAATPEAGDKPACHYSPRTLAERWGVDKETVCRLINRGDLVCIRISTLMRISHSAVAEYEKAHSCPGSSQVVDLEALTVPEMWHEWRRQSDKFPTASEQQQDQIGARMGAIEHRMVETRACTIDDLLVKLRLARALIKLLDGKIAEGKDIEDRLIISALADLERLDRQTEHVASDEPDPVIELAARYLDALEKYLAQETDEGMEAADTEFLTPAEDALEAARPTTWEGVATLLDVVLHHLGRDKEVSAVKLIENAREAVRVGVA